MAEDSTARDAEFAARFTPDVGVEQVAAVYAEALFGAAENAGATESVLAELDSLIADVLDRQPEFERFLASALISHEEKVGILERTLAAHGSPLLLRFLKVVSRHGRLDCLRAIQRQARGVYDKARGRVAVELVTAAPVPGEQAEAITASLRGWLKGEPVVHWRVDSELIGGAVVRVGDTVFDGSIAKQLETARQRIIDRSAHEIQSRRDRFGDPAGN
jgi:F-type H+-transporting ATPase subunit delta